MMIFNMPHHTGCSIENPYAAARARLMTLPRVLKTILLNSLYLRDFEVTESSANRIRNLLRHFSCGFFLK